MKPLSIERQISFDLDITVVTEGEITINPEDEMPRIIRTVVTLFSTKIGRKELCISFMVPESDSVESVLSQVTNQGILIDRDNANISVFFKKSCLTTTHRSSLKNRNGSFSFESHDDVISASNDSIQSNTRNTGKAGNAGNDEHDENDKATSSHLVITKEDWNQSLCTLHEQQHAIREDLIYEIELFIEESAWETTLEISLQHQDATKFREAVRALDMTFDELQEIFMMNSVGFRYYIQQRQQRKMEILSFSEMFVTTDLMEHSRSIIAECIDIIITNDNVEFLDIIFTETDLVEILIGGESDGSFKNAVNVLSFCLIQALQYQSKDIIHFLGQFWLKHVCHSYDEHDILNAFVASVKQRKDEEMLEFMGWIGSVIEPSMMSSFRELSTSPALSPKWIQGRVERYQMTKEILCKCLQGNMDLARIILDNDGYQRGLCDYVHHFTL